MPQCNDYAHHKVNFLTFVISTLKLLGLGPGLESQLPDPGV